MKRIAIAVGVALATVAATASAQIYYRPYVANSWDRDMECWNPRAGVFERLRPGDWQPDLDKRHCRPMGAYYGGRYDDNRYYRGARGYGERHEECWNPRAGVFERVRPGDWQPDLDRGRCRVIAYERYAWR